MANHMFNWSAFISDHWSIIALALSELAALLPGKYSGFLKSLVLIGSKLLSKKKKA